MPDFRDKLRNPGCELCPLHQGADHVCLMGGPNVKAKVMIVGEAPGAREDDEHAAFVGPSGKLLDRMLRDLVGVERSECYVTNVVKCRPPDNRTPELKELKVCVENYFEEELDRVRPDYLLLLGNSAMRGVLGKSGITKHAGTIHKITLGEDTDPHVVTVMPTLHPAAVLRNPAYGETLAKDLDRFGRMMRGEETSPQTTTRIIRTKGQIRWLKQQLMEADVISYDIETYTFPSPPPFVRTNFQEWWDGQSVIASIAFTLEAGSSIVLPLYHVQSPWLKPGEEAILDGETVGEGRRAKILPRPNPDLYDRCAAIIRFLAECFRRKGVKYLAHNGKFDARWMAALGMPVHQTFDTMLAAHMLEENRPKGLKPLSRTILGADPYDVGEDLKSAITVPLRRLCVYNGKDTDYTFRLWQVFRRQLVEDKRVAKIFRDLMMPASNVLVEVERTGVYVDPERWQQRHDEAREKVEILYNYINTFVPEERRPINLNSPPQVGRLFFGDLGLPIIEETAKGAPSTKESVLLRLAGQHQAATALIKYRKWAKFLSTYLLPFWYEHRDDNGRIHSNYKLFGTVTGRLSGEGGIQQVPRDPFIRSIIGAEPGWLFLAADYSQVELRIAAMLADERRMLRMFLNGEDIHLNTAASTSGKHPDDITKEERKKAKAVNFGFLYGMGAPKFESYAFDNYGVTVTPDEAVNVRDRFFETYPGLRPWHQRQRRLAERYHRVASPIGRVRHLPNMLSGDKEVRAESERQAINSPVQSFASDLMLLSLVELHRNVLKPKEVRVIGTVHDSILFEVREGLQDKWAPEIKRVMEDTGRVERQFGCDITVPIVADMEIGTHWGEPTHEWIEGKWKAA